MPMPSATRADTPSQASTSGARNSFGPSAVLAMHAGDPAGPLVPDRRRDRGGDPHPGAGLDREGGQHLVEVAPGPDQTEVREVLQDRPGQLQAGAAADHPQALVLDPVRAGDVDAQGEHLLDAARGQAVTADLVPREGGLLQQQHVDAGAGQIGGGRRTRPGRHRRR